MNATVQAPGHPAGLSSFQASVSYDGSDWQHSKLAVTNGTTTVTIPGYGVTTLYGVGLHADASSVDAGGHLQMVFSRDELS